MATPSRPDDASTTDRLAAVTVRTEWPPTRARGAVVLVDAVVCGLIYVGALFGAGVVAAGLGAWLPGVPGVVALLTVGLGVVSVAPEVAERTCLVYLDTVGRSESA